MGENNQSIVTIALGSNINIGQIVIIIAAILSICAIIYKGIISCFPKEIKSFTNFVYIDLKTKSIIEERQYEFFWGRLGFKKYQFPIFPRNPTLEFFYKPLLKLEDKIPFDKYIVFQKDSQNIIELTDTTFFKEAETEYIKIHAITETNCSDYLKNINVINQDDQIIVINDNNIEVRNFPVALPLDFEMEKRMKILKYGMLTVPEKFPGLEKTSPENEILLVTLPKKEKGEPKRFVIDLN